jgi:hypothetical protein
MIARVAGIIAALIGFALVALASLDWGSRGGVLLTYVGATLLAAGIVLAVLSWPALLG